MNQALLRDALAGLTATPKTLPCKWLYDERGAALFEEITRLAEYYPTRAERRILEGPAMREIATACPERAVVVEFGPGDGSKAPPVLHALRAPAAYVPVDIAAEWLEAVRARVAAACPGLPVHPVVADFTAPFTLPAGLPEGARLGFFPGSTIGNFTRAEAVAFLARTRAALGPGARLLLGADLVKPLDVLLPAYDDARGVTAAFNLNLLARLNREAGGDFDLRGFRHAARWNAAEERVEMHLVSLRPQQAMLGGQRIRFGAGESIHTENSHKYRPETLAAMAAEAGWGVAGEWRDPQELFGVWLLAGA